VLTPELQMPPVPWASLEQKVYLLAHCDAFIEAQKNKSVYKFWINIHQEWFSKWPEPGTEGLHEPDITDDIKLELGMKIDQRKKVRISFLTCPGINLTFPQKIKGWFNNHGSKARKSKPIVIQVNAKSRRRLQTTELYSRKFYDTKIKPKVDAEMEALSLPKKQ
jgi:hypothetical protein